MNVTSNLNYIVGTMVKENVPKYRNNQIQAMYGQMLEEFTFLDYWEDLWDYDN